MIDLFASAVIFAAGLFLVVLGVGCFLRPRLAADFLLGFASSASLHYLELALRILVGAALVQRAAALPYPSKFHAFGWVLILTSIGLSLVPWNWHRQFTQRAVPYALRAIKLLGASAIALGGLLASSVVAGSVA